MKKCKVCGQLFEYHVTNAHIESHGITREEYKKLPGKEDNFVIGSKPFSSKDDDLRDYVNRAVYKNSIRNNLPNKARH